MSSYLFQCATIYKCEVHAKFSSMQRYVVKIEDNGRKNLRAQNRFFIAANASRSSCLSIVKLKTTVKNNETELKEKKMQKNEHFNVP